MQIRIFFLKTNAQIVLWHLTHMPWELGMDCIKGKWVWAPVFHKALKQSPLVPGLLTELPFYKCAHKLIEGTVITGQGMRTAFGIKPSKLPFASGKTVKYFLLPGVYTIGSTKWSHETFTMFPSSNFPSNFSFKVATELQPNSGTLSSGLKGKTSSQNWRQPEYPTVKWQNGVSDPVPEALGSNKIACHSHSQELQFTARWTPLALSSRRATWRVVSSL